MNSDEQFDITILGKMMEKSWVVIMFYIWFKQICFVDPVPDRYNKADYVSTNKW